MREFFRRWRRKAGCVTLVIACVFSAGWVRSLTTADIIGISAKCLPKTTSFSQLATSNRGIEWRWVWPKTKGDYSNRSWSWTSSPIQGEVPNRDFEFGVEWKKSYCGVHVEGGTWGKQEMRLLPGLMQIVVVPYWIAILPLTLISAYLLLVKPRAPTSNKASKTALFEGV